MCRVHFQFSVYLASCSISAVFPPFIVMTLSSGHQFYCSSFCSCILLVIWEIHDLLLELSCLLKRCEIQCQHTCSFWCQIVVMGRLPKQNRNPRFFRYCGIRNRGFLVVLDGQYFCQKVAVVPIWRIDRFSSENGKPDQLFKTGTITPLWNSVLLLCCWNP